MNHKSSVSFSIEKIRREELDAIFETTRKGKYMPILQALKSAKPGDNLKVVVADAREANACRTAVIHKINREQDKTIWKGFCRSNEVYFYPKVRVDGDDE